MQLRSTQIPFAYLVTPFVLLLLFRSLDLTVPYYNIDEITNAVYAKLLINGDLQLKDFLGNTYIYTHYWYALIYKIFPANNLLYIHIFHLIWCLMTAYALKRAGDQITPSRSAGFLTALFYVVTSIGFLSKDYRAALSESLSLLPMSVAAYYYFSFINKPDHVATKGFLIGFCIGLAGLFKAPAVTIIAAFWLSLFFIKEKKSSLFLFSLLGLATSVCLPLLITTSPGEAFYKAIGKLQQTKKFYISSYDNLPILYWGIKYLMRTILILISTPIVVYFAIRTCQTEFVRSLGVKLKQREMILFCVFWFLSCWLMVSIGKRVFYHYFVFLIPSLCLLATPMAEQFWLAKVRGNQIRVFISFLLLLVIPVTFSVETYQEWSLKKYTFSNVTKYIESQTTPNEKIYVWGMVPQLYLFSNRSPASNFFWSDTLAGTSPGSAGMEYLRQSKGSDLGVILAQDFKPSNDLAIDSLPVTESAIMRNPISDLDLLRNDEMLDLMASPHWIQVFKDFEKSPPVLFLDTSPTGIRRFSAFPLEKYPLWSRFINDNYLYDRTIDNIVIYRLKK